MKINKIKVPLYNYNVISVIVESYDEGEAIAKLMRKYGLSKDNINALMELLQNQAMNGANCYYNDNKLTALIVTFPHKNNIELCSTLVHEGRHAADRFISLSGLEGVEAAAYLNEYITINMIKEYIIK